MSFSDFQELLLLRFIFLNHLYRLLGRKAVTGWIGVRIPKLSACVCFWYSDFWFTAKPTNFSHLFLMQEDSKQARGNRIQRTWIMQTLLITLETLKTCVHGLNS